MGIIHCDIQPKNFLIDEYGIVKFSNFKLARKIPTAVVGDTALSSRGYIPYLAPELFSPEGVFSYSSDIWSLGCLLFTLITGKFPFGDDTEPPGSFAQSVTTVDPFEIINDMDDRLLPSVVFLDLLEWMIEKSPAARCEW